MRKPISLVILTLAIRIATAQPALTKQPANQSVSLGASVTFQAAATGSAPLHFQWHFESAEILNATNRNLTLTNMQMANAGEYFVIGSNGSGAVTSQVAHLEVDPAFQTKRSGISSALLPE